MSEQTPQSSPPSESPSNGGFLGLKIEPLYYLLIAVPIAVVLRIMGGFGVSVDLWLFLASCVAVIPLAGLMGRATENLAETLGAGIGGLLNATFGNAAELIIALVALYYGKNELVKASITGSIIGNVLLVLGLSILVGGTKYKKQTFNRTAAGMGATLLALASIGLLIPTVFYYLPIVFPDEYVGNEPGAFDSGGLSIEIAIVLAVVYVLSLWFSLRTHSHLFAGPEEHLPTMGEGHKPEWNRQISITVLTAATVGVAIVSEFLVGAVEGAAPLLGMTHVFVGVIVVSVVGNASEHSTAILVAAKNKMDLAYTIAVGSSIQIALFVAPVLLFASLLFVAIAPDTHVMLDFHFTPMEIIAVLVAIAAVALVAVDGESHWMEGIMLLAVYIILGLAFYNLPEKKSDHNVEGKAHSSLVIPQRFEVASRSHSPAKELTVTRDRKSRIVRSYCLFSMDSSSKPGCEC
ncbi:MAG: calcium/proton exchanger [Gemmataceae bacterium]